MYLIPTWSRWFGALAGGAVALGGWLIYQRGAGSPPATTYTMSRFELQQLIDRLELAIAATSTSSALAFVASLSTVILPFVAAAWWLWRCEREKLGDAELVRALQACGIEERVIIELVRLTAPAPQLRSPMPVQESHPPFESLEFEDYDDEPFDSFPEPYHGVQQRRRRQSHSRRQRHRNGR